LDALLDRIRTVLRHEQQLTGELSHAMRTPLTRIVAELDWWRARPRSAGETAATHEVIAEAAQSMRTICDTLLNDAREGAQNTTTAVGATAVAPVLRRLVEDLDTQKQLKTVVDVPNQQFEAGVTSALLERIVSPLLANAVR
jgi:K+-sensing histidine kinase KdpD